MNPDEFTIGEYYTRRDIHNAFGGEIQSYLPQRDKQIVAGCFGQRMNPDAPKEVQVGIKPKVVRKAEMLAEQAEMSLPVFIKDPERGESRAIWRYEGRYRFVDLVDNKASISKAAKRSERSKKDLTYLLHLEPAN